METGTSESAGMRQDGAGRPVSSGDLPRDLSGMRGQTLGASGGRAQPHSSPQVHCVLGEVSEGGGMDDEVREKPITWVLQVIGRSWHVIMSEVGCHWKVLSDPAYISEDWLIALWSLVQKQRTSQEADSIVRQLGGKQ